MSNKSSGIAAMQLSLHVPNYILLKYKIRLYAGVLLNYYSDASWKYDKFILAGDLFVRAEYDFDILQKNTGLSRELSKRSFVTIMKELDEAGVIVKFYRGHKLYIHVFPSVLHDLKNAKILMDDERIEDLGLEELSEVETKKESKRSSARALKDFYQEIMEIYPMKVFSSSDETKIKQMKLIDRREEFIGAVKNLCMTEKVANGFSPKLSNFLKEWESYAAGIPQGVKAAAGVDVKKIGSGAAKVSNDPIFDLVQKCMRLKSDWFDTLVYEKNSSQMSAADVVEDGVSYFSDIEIHVINEIGFKQMLRECTDGDFVVGTVIPVWEKLK